MAAKKSEIKSEIKSEMKSGKQSTSATPKVSRKKPAVQVEEVSQIVAAPVAAAPVAVAPVAGAAVDEALVRARAHAIFQQHGGSAFDNWLAAEREIGASA